MPNEKGTESNIYPHITTGVAECAVRSCSENSLPPPPTAAGRWLNQQLTLSKKYQRT